MNFKNEFRKSKPTIIVLSFLLTTGFVMNYPSHSEEIDSTIEQSSINNVPLEVTITDTNVNYVIPETIKYGSPKIWYNGVIGDDSNITDDDLAHKLKKLWDYKITTTKVKPSVVKSVDTIINKYTLNEKSKSNINLYLDDIQANITNVSSTLRYNDLCNKYKMNDKECKVLKKVSSVINEKELLSYGMTELMPSYDGNKNIRILDKVLKNAGTEYINNIPAFGDGLLSKGQYQFTSYAVKHDSNGPEGASIISQYVDKNYKIPGSVMNLTADDQHKAAYMFSVYNIMRMVRKLNDNQLDKLNNMASSHKSDIVQYIAVSHHMPNKTIDPMKKWINDGGKSGYIDHLGPYLKKYALKTKNNYKALTNMS